MLKVKIYRTSFLTGFVLGDPVEVFVGDYPVKNFTANFQVKSAASFSFEIDFNQFSNFPFVDNTVYSFYLYRYDTLLYTGLIGTVDADYITKKVRFNCEDRTFYLSFFKADPLRRWEARNIAAVVQYLFDNITGFPWLPVYFAGSYTVRDLELPSRTVTIDTTNDETLLAQLNTIINSIPNAYLFSDNVVGVSDYIPGVFGQPFGWMYHIRSYTSDPIYTIASENIQSFNTSWEQQPALGRVRVYGAEYDAAGTPAIVNLALKTIPDLTGFTSDIVNSTVANDAAVALDASQFRETLKIFDEIKPKTLSSPTNAQIRRAAHALYRRAVRFLQEYESSRRYNLSVKQDLTGIEIGNRIQIYHKTIIPKINQATAQITYFDAGNLDLTGVYYVESIRANYNEDDVTFDLVVLDNNNFLTRDPDVVAYKGKKDQKLKTYNTEPTVRKHGFFDITIGPGLAANCDSNTGRSVSFTKSAGDFQDMAGGAIGATDAADYYWYDVQALEGGTSGTASATTSPTAVGATFTFCVKVDNNWTTSSSARLRVLVAWPG